MPISKIAPHRRNSVFGPGQRVPRDREFRAVYKAKLRFARRRKGVTHETVCVGEYLAGLCGRDGRLDPSNDTIAAACRISASTASLARERLRFYGFLDWDRRLLRVRDPASATGWRTVQHSNAYRLLMPDRNADTDFRKAVSKGVFYLSRNRPDSVSAQQAEANASRDRQLQLLNEAGANEQRSPPATEMHL